MPVAVLNVLVFVSGACALVYEVVWQKYLAILLGAQSRAVVLVLCVFLGGLGCGYYLFGKIASRWSRHSVALYGVLEVLIGLWALLFPSLFKIAFSQSPQLYRSWGLESLWLDLVLSLVLILVPTILMGGTLPLLTQGASRSLQGSSRTHAALYGFNTLGAFVGCVGTAFLLLPFLSLPQILVIGAAGNILVGLLAYFWPLQADNSLPVSPPPEMISASPVWQLLGISFLSGLALIGLQTVLIRLLGLSAGSAPHLFGIVVGLFTFGLGMGSLFIGNRSANRNSLFFNQALVAITWIGIYLTANEWPYWHHLLRLLFRDHAFSYPAYQIALALGLGMILAVPLLLAGATLPLCFHLLRDKMETLGSRVGQLYFANILGCIAGALGGGYVFLSFVDLDGVFRICLLAMATATFLAAFLVLRRKVVAVAFAICLLMIVLGLKPYDKTRYAQPFRVSTPVAASFLGSDKFAEFTFGKSEYLLFKDGADASIGISRTFHESREASRTVYVNGKSDGNTSGDFFTMQMTGHVPALLARELSDAFVIGFGTGITLGALANYPSLKNVDVAEISRTLLENKSLLDPYNGYVSKDPRFKYFGMDAFRFLQGSSQQYDLIISEPSNPWVCGVENLYSEEFYQMTRAHLKPRGILAQWLQGYSFNDELFRMVLGTLSKSYPFVHVFQLREYDLLLVASDSELNREDVLAAVAKTAHYPGLQAALVNIGIGRMESVLAMEAITPDVSRFLGRGAGTHSLEKPRLAHLAGGAFFAKSLVDLSALPRLSQEYYQRSDKSLLNRYTAGNPISQESFRSMRHTFCENAQAFNSPLCRQLVLREKLTYPNSLVTEEYRHLVSSSDEALLNRFLGKLLKEVPSEDPLHSAQILFNFFQKNFSPLVNLPTAPILAHLKTCLLKTDFYSKEQGECLLQKAALLELVSNDRTPFLDSADEFIGWFGRYPRDAYDWDRFRDAKESIKRMRDIQASALVFQ